MSTGSHILKRQISSRSVYRRTHEKRDGRKLYLYGYRPHIDPALDEDFADITKGGELRFHPFRQEWNIYASHRQNRTFNPSLADDPLAPTQQGLASTEIPFSSFELAIFENKFTSLHPEAPQPALLPNIQSKSATGVCEVVVYTPKPTGSLFTIGQDNRLLLVSAWIDRYQNLFELGYKFVMPFENRGHEVGVTLGHPHGQIYAFSFIPAVQKKMSEVFASGYDFAQDVKAFKSKYEINNIAGMSAFSPAYARFPFEIWITSERRVAGIWDLSDEELGGLAYLLGDMTRRYDQYFQRPTPLMMTLQCSPLGYQDSFHFSVQFYPILRAPERLKYLASVEQATGTFTVDVMPEDTADILRGM